VPAQTRDLFDSGMSMIENWSPSPKTMYVSALLNYIPKKTNKADLEWKGIVEKLVVDVNAFAMMNPEMCVIVQLPFYRSDNGWIVKNFQKVNGCL